MNSGKSNTAAMDDRTAHFRAIFENSLDAIALYSDWPPTHEMVNPAYAELFGYTSVEELLEIPSLELIAPTERAFITDIIHQRLAGEKAPSLYETRGLRKDGTEFDLELHATTFEAGDTILRLVILRDVTARKYAESSAEARQRLLKTMVEERTAKLYESKKRLEEESIKRRDLEAAMRELTERERRKIGSDLHESVGQDLTAANFLIYAVEDEIRDDKPEAVAQLAKIRKLIEKTMEEVHNIASGLSPFELMGRRLEDALLCLRTYVSDVSSVACRIEIDPKFEFETTASREIYRIVQEAMSNAVRHGRAQCIRVSIRKTDDGVRLTIEDDGIGIPGGERRAGLGFSTMEYRARSLEGAFEIQSRAGSGTTIQCDLPASVLVGGSTAPAA